MSTFHGHWIRSILVPCKNIGHIDGLHIEWACGKDRAMRSINRWHPIAPVVSERLIESPPRTCMMYNYKSMLETASFMPLQIPLISFILSALLFHRAARNDLSHGRQRCCCRWFRSASS